jgi:hypothetical protein
MNNTAYLRQLALTLRQPQWIAVILSVGFHGVLFAAGPSFSSLNMNALGGDVPEAERRQVPLIELTPEEQSRLPDFSRSAYSLFPDEAAPFELFPPSGSTLPLNPIPDGNLNSPQATPRPLPSPGDGSVGVGIAPYTPPPRPSISFLPRRSPLNRLPGGSPFSNGLPVPRVENTPPAAEGTPSEPTLVEPDPASGPTASALYPDAGEGNPSMSLNGSEASDAPKDPLQAQVEALAYRPENTTEEEAEANLETWQANLEERLPGQLETAEDPIEMQLSYVQRLCLDPEPTDARLGLVALPTEAGDDLELFPQVLKSTGYPFLDREAAFALNDLKQPPETEAEGLPVLEPAVMYQVNVNVEYDRDSCIDRESLLEEIKANQDATPAPATGNTAPEPSPSPNATGAPSRSEPLATPEENQPAAETAPDESSVPNADGVESPDDTSAPGAEALEESGE